MKIRYAKKNEKNIAKKFWEDSFKDEEKFIDFYFNKIYDHKNFLVLEENKEIKSSLHENPYNIIFNSYEIKSRYIVGVASLITERAKGYMRELLNEMLKNSKKRAIPFIFLTPINPDIYRKFGFEYFSSIEKYSFSISQLADFIIDKQANFFEITRENMSNYFNDLIKIYNENMNNIFSYLKRDDYYFKKLLEECYVDDMKVFILYKNNKPSAYIIYSLNQDDIDVRECFAINKSAYENIFSFLYSYKDYYKYINVTTRINLNLEFLFKNQIKIDKSQNLFMMMRILEPLKVFEMLDLKIENLKIKLNDKILSENTGFYTYSNREWKYSKKNIDYDFEIDIKDLTSLVTGFLSFDDLLFLEKINLKNIEKFDELKNIFTKKISYLYEFI